MTVRRRLCRQRKLCCANRPHCPHLPRYPTSPVQSCPTAAEGAGSQIRPERFPSSERSMGQWWFPTGPQIPAALCQGPPILLASAPVEVLQATSTINTIQPIGCQELQTTNQQRVAPQVPAAAASALIITATFQGRLNAFISPVMYLLNDKKCNREFELLIEQPGAGLHE